MARAKRFYEELADFAETVPPAMAEIIEKFRRGTMEIHMEHKKLERSVNRLVFGILTASSSWVLLWFFPHLFRLLFLVFRPWA